MEGRWITDREDYDGHDQWQDQLQDIEEMREEEREVTELEARHW